MVIIEEDKNISNGSFEYTEDKTKIGQYRVFEDPITSGDLTTYDEKTYDLYIWIEETNLNSITIKRASSEGMTLRYNWYGTCPEENIFYQP